MNLGLAPIKRKDHRTYDFHKTFGAVTPEVLPQEFNFDVSGVMPNQLLDGLPNACTAYAENDTASNDDGETGTEYYDDQLFTYNNTKMMMGVTGNVPVDQMTALKSGTVYGVKRKSQTADQALQNRRAPYFIVRPLNGSYFDGLISAMWKKQGGLSIGTPWLPEFELIGKDGIIPNFLPPKRFETGHCWEACGLKVVGGVRYIICKSWQGAGYGDGGYCYFNCTQTNDLLGVRGTGAFGQKHASPEDIQTVQMSILETIISYLQMWIDKYL